MTLGEKLQRLRKARALSQEELAAQLEVSRQAVSKWELDAAMPDTDKIVKLSELYGVTTDYLLKNEECTAQAATPAPTITPPPAQKKPLAAILLTSIGGGIAMLMWVLSAVNPVEMSCGTAAVGGAETEMHTYIGLEAFLRYYNLTLPFVLACVTLGLGVLLFIAYGVRRIVRKKREIK